MANNGVIQEMVSQSAQSRFSDDPDKLGSGIANVISGIVKAGELLPAEWSRPTDIDKARVVLQSDHVQGAV